MTNYFTSIGTKPTIKSDKPFTKDDAKPELLLDYYRREYSTAVKSDRQYLTKIDEIYKQWCLRLFHEFNIVVQGPQSKFRLLETFRQRYLELGKLEERKITTIRLHGFAPVSLENFNNSLFGTTDRRSASREDRDKFLKKAKDSGSHYIFLMHSFEELYKESKDVCDIIFQLCRGCPEFCHIILSSDHINAGKVLDKLKLPLRLVFYVVPVRESFFYERTHAAIVDGTNKGVVIDQNLELASLNDVHQAMQKSCQLVMVYILKHHFMHSHMNQLTGMSLEFNQLFQHCESRFWLRRANMLRAHLGELIDHSVIKMEGNNIHCLVEFNTCKRFLQSIGEDITPDGDSSMRS